MTVERSTLKTLIPALEVEWAMPGALFLVIVGAAAAETWIVGVAVQELYRLGVGWVIGGVVALLQMLGSMIMSRNAQHNSQRYIRHVKKTDPKNPSGEKVLMEDKVNSEPRLVVWLPLTISLLAGIVSGSLALALYAQDGGLSFLDVTLAVAAPVGSSGAAILNAVFVYGEQAVQEWRAEQAKKKADRASGSQSSDAGERSGQRSANAGQRSTKRSANAERFTCAHCGAGSNKRGDPFETIQALSAHLGKCEKYQATKG